MLIIGENYDALKNLLLTYRNKIDVIYIDPPYNTDASANEKNNLSELEVEERKSTKFIYRDKFSHTGWLNLMQDRLYLAKDLLSDEGVIFVSINDDEQAYLKVLMDDIFGEENFVGNLFWQSNNSVMKQFSFFRNDFEFIICYAKNKNLVAEFTKKENVTMEFKNIDNDPNGPWFSSNATYKYDEENEKTFDIVLPNGNSIKRTWRFTKEEYKNGSIPLYFNGNNVPRLKIYKKVYSILKPYSNVLYSLKKLSIKEQDHTSEDLQNIIKFVDSLNIVDSFTKTKNELKKLSLNFETPKPSNLISFLINLHKNKDAIVLDFFAGSGTTAQAVMELNQKDNGNRKFILVTNNIEINDTKKYIGYDICYERIYRVINGIGSKGETINWSYSNEIKSLKNNSVMVFDVNYADVSIKADLTETLNEFKTSMKLIDKNFNIDDEESIIRKLYSLHPYKKENN